MLALRPRRSGLRKQFLPRRQERAGRWKITAGFFLKGENLLSRGRLVCSASAARWGVNKGGWRSHDISTSRGGRNVKQRAEQQQGGRAARGRGVDAVKLLSAQP